MNGRLFLLASALVLASCAAPLREIPAQLDPSNPTAPESEAPAPAAMAGDGAAPSSAPPDMQSDSGAPKESPNHSHPGHGTGGKPHVHPKPSGAPGGPP